MAKKQNEKSGIEKNVVETLSSKKVWVLMG